MNKPISLIMYCVRVNIPTSNFDYVKIRHTLYLMRSLYYIFYTQYWIKHFKHLFNLNKYVSGNMQIFIFISLKTVLTEVFVFP